MDEATEADSATLDSFDPMTWIDSLQGRMQEIDASVQATGEGIEALNAEYRAATASHELTVAEHGARLAELATERGKAAREIGALAIAGAATTDESAETKHYEILVANPEADHETREATSKALEHYNEAIRVRWQYGDRPIIMSPKAEDPALSTVLAAGPENDISIKFSKENQRYEAEPDIMMRGFGINVDASINPESLARFGTVDPMARFILLGDPSASDEDREQIVNILTESRGAVPPIVITPYNFQTISSSLVEARNILAADVLPDAEGDTDDIEQRLAYIDDCVGQLVQVADLHKDDYAIGPQLAGRFIELLNDTIIDHLVEVKGKTKVGLMSEYIGGRIRWPKTRRHSMPDAIRQPGSREQGRRDLLEKIVEAKIQVGGDDVNARSFSKLRAKKRKLNENFAKKSWSATRFI